MAVTVLINVEIVVSVSVLAMVTVLVYVFVSASLFTLTVVLLVGGAVWLNNQLAGYTSPFHYLAYVTVTVPLILVTVWIVAITVTVLAVPGLVFVTGRSGNLEEQWL